MHADWHVFTVLEEMESEGVVVHHSIEHLEEVNKHRFLNKTLNPQTTFNVYVTGQNYF